MAKNYKNRKSDSTNRWTQVNGTMRVYGNERKTRNGKPYLAYQTSIGRKNDDNEWDNLYVTVRFPKEDPEITEAFDIDIKDGFLSMDVWTDKNGVKHTTPVVVVTDYEIY